MHDLGVAMNDLSLQKEWLATLVGYDTTSSRSNLEIIDHIEDALKNIGAETFRIPNDDGGKANLVGVVGPKVAGGVVLSGHTDVVPVDGQDWHTDPWTLTEKDGLLYGRGTCDMKAFPAIALSLLPEMVAADLKRPIVFALSYDEEIGCLGAPRMIDKICSFLPHPEAVIVGEPTMMDVIDGHKGIASFRTTVSGFTTHSSQTDRGVSAVEAAAVLIAKVTGMRESRAENADKSLAFDPPYSTMTVNVANGGTQLNIMAAQCQFDWDCRVIPGESAADIFADFSEFCAGVEEKMRARAPSCSIVTVQMTDAPPLAPNKNNPAANLAKSLTGLNSTGVVSYAAEAGQFQQAGLSTVICGPGSIDQAHQANEFIENDQLAQGTVFMKKLISRLAT